MPALTGPLSKFRKDAGFNWLDQEYKDKIIKWDSVLDDFTSLVGEAKLEETLAAISKEIHSKIAYSVNVNGQNPSLIGWQHDSAEEYAWVDFASQMTPQFEKLVEEELTRQGYDSLQQKQTAESAVQSKVREYDNAESQLIQLEKQLSDLKTKRSETESLLEKLLAEKQEVTAASEDTYRQARSGLYFEPNDQFKISNLRLKKSSNFGDKQISLEGKLQNNTKDYINATRYAVWIFAEDMDPQYRSGPAKLNS